MTSTYADTGNTERLTAGATSFTNGTLGVTTQTTSGVSLSYIRDPSGTLVAMHTAGQSYYYTADAQGSVIAITDSAQALAAAYTYDPWGNTTSTGALAAINTWTYATGYTDTATGYLKLGARYYNPTTARFTQPDPAQTCGGYAYAGDDPANNTDPTGRDYCLVAIGAGAAGGFATGLATGLIPAIATAGISVPVAAVGGAFLGGLGGGVTCGVANLLSGFGS